MTSIVLAGGRSSRFGWNKALQDIEGKSLIQWVVDCLAVFSTEIIIATARGERIPCSSTVRMKTVADVYPGKGPLAGIYSGLAASTCPTAIVVGCDMPFVSGGLLEYMSRISPAFDVVVPVIRTRVEPLCAVYSKECLVPIRRLLEQDKLRPQDLFSMVRVRYVEEDEFTRFDREHLSLLNINSRADLNRAREVAIRKGWLRLGVGQIPYLHHLPDTHI